MGNNTNHNQTSAFLSETQKRKIIDSIPKHDGINLLYRGSDHQFKTEPFFEKVYGGMFEFKKKSTLCVVKTLNGAIFGMYTDIFWDTKVTTKKKNGRSFVFKLDGNNITIYRHNGKGDEVYHNDWTVFAMYSGPVAIKYNQDETNQP